jgi:hypothetical protein
MHRRAPSPAQAGGSTTEQAAAAARLGHHPERTVGQPLARDQSRLRRCRDPLRLGAGVARSIGQRSGARKCRKIGRRNGTMPGRDRCADGQGDGRDRPLGFALEC